LQEVLQQGLCRAQNRLKFADFVPLSEFPDSGDRTACTTDCTPSDSRDERFAARALGEKRDSAGEMRIAPGGRPLACHVLTPLAP